jgi:hypothetical protein
VRVGLGRRVVDREGFSAWWGGRWLVSSRASDRLTPDSDVVSPPLVYSASHHVECCVRLIIPPSPSRPTASMTRSPHSTIPFRKLHSWLSLTERPMRGSIVLFCFMRYILSDFLAQALYGLVCSMRRAACGWVGEEWSGWDRGAHPVPWVLVCLLPSFCRTTCMMFGCCWLFDSGHDDMKHVKVKELECDGCFARHKDSPPSQPT